MVLYGTFLILLLAILNSAPLAFFIMLFLGNVELHLGFLDLLPGAMAIHVIKNNLVTYNKKEA